MRFFSFYCVDGCRSANCSVVVIGACASSCFLCIGVWNYGFLVMLPFLFLLVVLLYLVMFVALSTCSFHLVILSCSLFVLLLFSSFSFCCAFFCVVIFSFLLLISPSGLCCLYMFVCLFLLCLQRERKCQYAVRPVLAG